MLDIMKGQLRQLMRTRLIHLTFGVFAASFLLITFLECTVNTRERIVVPRADHAAEEDDRNQPQQEPPERITTADLPH